MKPATKTDIFYGISFLTLSSAILAVYIFGGYFLFKWLTDSREIAVDIQLILAIVIWITLGICKHFDIIDIDGDLLEPFARLLEKAWDKSSILIIGPAIAFLWLAFSVVEGIRFNTPCDNIPAALIGIPFVGIVFSFHYLTRNWPHRTAKYPAVKEMFIPWVFTTGTSVLMIVIGETVWQLSEYAGCTLSQQSEQMLPIRATVTGVALLVSAYPMGNNVSSLKVQSFASFVLWAAVLACYFVGWTFVEGYSFMRFTLMFLALGPCVRFFSFYLRMKSLEIDPEDILEELNAKH